MAFNLDNTTLESLLPMFVLPTCEYVIRSLPVGFALMLNCEFNCGKSGGFLLNCMVLSMY